MFILGLDLTEEELLELDNPGYKRRKANWDIESMLKSMPEFEVVDTVGVDYWNDWVKKNRIDFGDVTPLERIQYDIEAYA